MIKNKTLKVKREALNIIRSGLKFNNITKVVQFFSKLILRHFCNIIIRYFFIFTLQKCLSNNFKNI